MALILALKLLLIIGLGLSIGHHARLEADVDARRIMHGLSIDHSGALKRRITEALPWCLICGALLSILGGPPYLNGLFGAPLIAWGAWDYVFRRRLNASAGKDWWYLGPVLAKRKPGDSVIDGWYHKAASLIWKKHPKHLPGIIAYAANIIGIGIGIAVSML